MVEDEKDGQDRADPHSFPWYFRLMDFFGLTTHPLAAEEVGGDRDDFNTRLQEYLQQQYTMPGGRVQRYSILREMDNFDLVSAIIDVYAEEVTQPDYDRGRILWVESRHARMIEAADVCLTNIMFEERAYGLARQTFLLGDDMRRNLYQTGKGVLGWKWADPAKVHRVEDKYDRLVGFREDGQKGYRGKERENVSFPWDYIHCRLTGKDNETNYGWSAAAGLFRPWRQLALLEDSDLMYNLRRAADRNLVLVDTGNMDDVESNDRLRRFQRRLKQDVFIDPASSQYRKNYNPLTPIEDIFMALRGPEDQTRVESLAGNASPLSPERLDHYRRKLFGAAKVPQAYFGFEGDINAKATLMQQDVRFARTMKRGQKAIVQGVRNTLDIHFMLFADDPAKNEYNIQDNPYTVVMSPISYLDEMERLELVQLRYGLIEAMAGLGQVMQLDATGWATYILLHYAKLPEDVVTILLRKGDAAAQGGAPPQPGGGFMPGGGGGGPSIENILGRNGGGAEHLRTQQRKLTTLVEERYGKPGRDAVQGKWKAGFYEPTAEEQKRIAEAIHNSPMLRKVIGDIADYHEDDDSALQQSDPTLLPPRWILNEEGQNREVIWLEDSVGETDDVRRLREDVEKLKKGETLTEQSPTQ